MKNENMLVSVIIPVYMVEKYLKRSLDSVAGQSYDNLEILLVDDGSRDGCGRICDEYAQHDERFQVIHKENGGLGSARNAGLDRAHGDWICFVDSDDYLEPDLVERVMKGLQGSECKMCAFSYITERPSGPCPRELLSDEPVMFSWSSTNEYIRFMARNFFMHGIGWEAWNRFYRRDLIEEYGLRFMNEKQVGAEDLCFCFEYLLHTDRVLYLPDRLYHYMVREDSIMGHVKWDTWADKLSRMMEMLEERTEKKGYPDIAAWFWLFYGVFFEYSFKNVMKAEGRKAVKSYMDTVSNLSYREQQFAEFLDRKKNVKRICGLVNGGTCLNLIRYFTDGAENGYRLREWYINRLRSLVRIRDRISR